MSHPVSRKLARQHRHKQGTVPAPSTPKAKHGSMPAVSFVRRHSRLVRVAKMLDADCTTAPELIARELKIGRRTLYRDLALLRRAGVRLVYCREEGRYRLDTLYMRLALGLTKKEAAA